jgi:hypothetical protein
MKHLKSCFALAGVVLVLSACGGGGGGGDASAAPADPLAGVPTEATQSVSGWIDFLGRLSKAAGADSAEGFEISSTGVTSVPLDEVNDPAVLNP